MVWSSELVAFCKVFQVISWLNELNGVNKSANSTCTFLFDCQNDIRLPYFFHISGTNKAECIEYTSFECTFIGQCVMECYVRCATRNKGSWGYRVRLWGLHVVVNLQPSTPAALDRLSAIERNGEGLCWLLLPYITVFAACLRKKAQSQTWGRTELSEWKTLRRKDDWRDYKIENCYIGHLARH